MVLKNSFLDIKENWSDYGINTTDTIGRPIIALEPNNPLNQIIKESIPNSLNEFNKKDYLISEGSLGKGKRTEAPWIATFHSDITTSATEEYYLVYLFDCDLKNIYLSLGLGSFQFAKVHGNSKKALSSMSSAAKILREASSYLKDINLDSNVSKRLIEGSIDLLPPGKGYSPHKAYGESSIYSLSYNLDDLPDDELLWNDYRDLINLYTHMVNDPSIPNIQELLISTSKIEKSKKEIEIIDFVPREPRKKTAKGQGSKSHGSGQRGRSKAAVKIGMIGEEIVYKNEKSRLIKEGREDLSEKVIWCKDDPNNRKPGYDILSFDKDGNQKFIEVKSTTDKKDTSSVILTAHEWEVAQKDSFKEDYYIYLVPEVLNHKKIEILRDPYQMVLDGLIEQPTISTYQLFLNSTV